MRLFRRFNFISYPRSGRWWYLLPLFTLLGSCETDAPQDIRDYYFPLRALTTGQVYEYRPIGLDSLTPDYWYYRTIPTDSAYYFTKTYYQADFIPQQLIQERLVDNGLLTSSIFLFETDSTGKARQMSGIILSPNAFPFIIEDSTYVTYQVRFPLPHGRQTVTIHRRYRSDTTFTFAGEAYPAVAFAIDGTVDVRDSIEGDIEPPFWGEEIYAEGLGLVAYRRSFQKEERGIEYLLFDRYPMDELEDQAKEAWE
jgi:hypothetical protein